MNYKSRVNRYIRNNNLAPLRSLEEIATSSANNEEEMGTISVDDPLLRYTNHERHENENADSAV